ncbi:MAG: hypothetical protein ACE5HW_07215, partial [Candidatus Methanofastidiosia archaeon]
MRKCEYKYKIFSDKKCPHEALEGKDVCYWHEERDWKNPREELSKYDFKNFDLTEAYLIKASLEKINLEETQLKAAS